jgi:chromosome segregation ATPase
MSEGREAKDLRARGEEALGELAQAVFENPLVGRAIRSGLEASERAAAAQRSALRAANVASLDDVKRLEQRLRSLASRLESLEDAVDELAELVAERTAPAAQAAVSPAPEAAAGGEESAAAEGAGDADSRG